MTTPMAILVVLALFIALAAAARLFGCDSRDGRDWQPRDSWAR